MKQYAAVLRQAANDWYADNCLRLGASLSYYTLGSLFPLLFLVTAVATFFLTQTHLGQDVQGKIINQLSASIYDPNLKQLLSDGLKGASIRTANKGVLGTALGVGLLLFIASGVFSELDDAFNIIWNVPNEARGQGIMGFIRYKIFSFSLVLGLAFLLLVSTVLNTILTSVTDRLPLGPLWAIVGTLLHFGVTSGVIALLFKYLPDTFVAWGDVIPGAVFTGILWTIGQVLMTLYFKYLGSGMTAYGVFGSVLAFLFYVYFSAQILFFGGEVTQAYANLCGSRKPIPNPKAQPVLSPEATLLMTANYQAQAAKHQATLTEVRTRHIAVTATVGVLGLIGGAALGGVGLIVGLGRAARKMRRR
ncbi:MAG: YihY/virulence factor BrkB family protein [Herpetosiphonaceae bacterium]|nr:YihY/virulence factor BrkB family protein [Herpetosiphonaceae bacterium]